MKVCVDNRQNVRDIAEVADAQGVTIGILIEVSTSMGRAGVRDAEQAVELFSIIQQVPHVDVRNRVRGGIEAGHIEIVTVGRIVTAVRRRWLRAVDRRDL